MTAEEITTYKSDFSEVSDDSEDWEHISKLKRQQSDPLYWDVNHSFSIEFTHVVYLKRLSGGAWQPESVVLTQTQNYSSFQLTSREYMATVSPYPTVEYDFNATSNLLVLTLFTRMQYEDSIKEMQFSSIFNITSLEFSAEQVERDIVETISGPTMFMIGPAGLGVLWIFWRRKKRLKSLQ